MWLFNNTTPNNPITGYSAQDSFNTYASMLNEGIQNSMDAVLNNNEPVHIKISLSQIDKNTLHEFLFNDNNAKQHFKQTKDVTLTTESNVTILKFEDSNTTGISGGVCHEKDSDSAMYAFLLSEGVTSTEKKNEATGGSRGIGKSAFIYTSAYHTFFLSTKSNSGEMHIGRAYLEPKRKIENQTYTKDCYFVHNTNENEKIHSMRDDTLDTFKDVFKTNRTENGTSIFILSPKYDETKTDNDFIQSTISAIVQNYYFLCMENKLCVTVTDSQDKPHDINQDTIYEQMEKHGFSDGFISFIRNMYESKDIPEIPISDEPQNIYKDFKNKITESIKTRYLNHYHSGNIFKVCFPIWVNTRKETIPVYIQKSTDGDVDRIHLRRHILHISKTADNIKNTTKKKMYIGIDICPQQPTEEIQKILKKCENENHTEWKIQNKKLHDTIRLNITKYIPEFLRDILQNESPQKQETFSVFNDVFAPFFPKTKSDRTANTGGGDTTHNNDNNRTKLNIDSTDKDFSISQVDRGFSIQYAPNKKPQGDSIVIRLGYAQEHKGKAQCIKAYKPWMFTVDNMKTQVTGATIAKQKNNEIHLINVSPDFTFKIMGFDPAYDLVMDIQEVDDETHT